MSVFFVDISHVVQHLLTSGLRMRRIKFVPFVSENFVVQKVVQAFRNPTQILKRVHLLFGHEPEISLQDLLLSRVVDHNFTLQFRVRVEKRFAVIF